jgi:hypothetical protein
MVWLMNRARSGPIAEGQFLSATGDPQVLAAINFFGVNLSVLQTEFSQLAIRPPAAFDIELHEASRLHSVDLIARDAQDHDGQIAKVQNSGFACNGGRFSVFSYTESALHGHAALNIDWGPGTDGTQDPPGHRYAIMDVPPGGVTSLSNAGLALVPDANPATEVGPLVFSGAYCQGGSGEQNRFIIGTVWNDQDSDMRYDEGEGIGGVTVMPGSGTYYAVTGTAGGFAIPVGSGNYTVSFSGGGLGANTFQLQTVVGGGSVLMDLNTAAQPPVMPQQVPTLPWFGVVILFMSIAGMGIYTARGSRRSARPALPRRDTRP